MIKILIFKKYEKFLISKLFLLIHMTNKNYIISFEI